MITLFIDSVVWDNNDAQQRQGVEPTYAKVKGFQPLEISWGPYVVDAIFRSGSVHSNKGNDVMKSVSRLTCAIRKHYRDVPIIISSDSGFMDDTNFRFFEEKLRIFYICGGKAYDDLKQYIQNIEKQDLKKLTKGNQTWHYIEFGNRLKSWTKFRRCIFTSMQTDENGQLLFDFARPDMFIYSNIGLDPLTKKLLISAGGRKYLHPKHIILADQQRGKSELNHRSRKQFAGKETFPFVKLGMNRSYYYFMLVTHVLYKAYKHDVTYDVAPVNCYPETFRRSLIDFAVKIVSTGGRILMKITRTAYEQLQIQTLWERSGNPVPLYQT